ncbi:MAG TPA: VOC family protein [Acidimicrobiales bacterium]|nr:VOC family protein [Acidimicrobiales bacterium]
MTGINHVVLHVNDVERSVKFYMEVLGFESRSISVGSERKMSFLRCGIHGLDLFEVSGDVHGGEEMNHLALNVEAGDLNEVIEKLEKAGVDASERTPRNSVFIHDPDGHKIEMLPRSAHERARERESARATA